jgi:hypothetical protein
MVMVREISVMDSAVLESGSLTLIAGSSIKWYVNMKKRRRLRTTSTSGAISKWT